MTPDAIAKALASKTDALSKSALALIREQAAVIEESAKHVAHADTVMAENGRIIAASVPSPIDTPPITPMTAFDIASAYLQCAAVAANAWEQLDSDKWDKMSRTDVGYWMRGLIVRLITALPKPVIATKG